MKIENENTLAGIVAAMIAATLTAVPAAMPDASYYPLADERILTRTNAV